MGFIGLRPELLLQSASASVLLQRLHVPCRAQRSSGPPPNTALACRDEAGEESLVVNFDTDLRSTFFAKLYQHSGLKGGHVIMLGADEGSRYPYH